MNWSQMRKAKTFLCTYYILNFQTDLCAWQQRNGPDVYKVLVTVTYLLLKQVREHKKEKKRKV